MDGAAANAANTNATVSIVIFIVLLSLARDTYYLVAVAAIDLVMSCVRHRDGERKGGLSRVNFLLQRQHQKNEIKNNPSHPQRKHPVIAW